MKKVVLIFIILAAAALGYYFYSQKINTGTPATQENATPTTSAGATIPVPKAKIEELKMGGSSYADKKGVFTFLYPNDYKFKEQNDGEIVRVHKQGPTQKGQTEMYDGVIVHFQSVNLGGKSLDAYVDEQIKNATLDGTSEVASGKKSVVINGYSGFTYTLRGLGEFPYYVIQKDTNSKFAVIITTLVADPENVGFQEDVDAIFGTISLLK